MPKLTAFYRINESEAIQVRIPLTALTTEAVYAAKTVAVAALSEILADSIRQEREEQARTDEETRRQ